MTFDAHQEARRAAVNEACEDAKAAKDCTIDNLCEGCAGLAKQIEARLKRAYDAGRLSVGRGGGWE